MLTMVTDKNQNIYFYIVMPTIKCCKGGLILELNKSPLLNIHIILSYSSLLITCVLEYYTKYYICMKNGQLLSNLRSKKE